MRHVTAVVQVTGAVTARGPGGHGSRSATHRSGCEARKQGARSVAGRRCSTLSRVQQPLRSRGLVLAGQDDDGRRSCRTSWRCTSSGSGRTGAVSLTSNSDINRAARRRTATSSDDRQTHRRRPKGRALIELLKRASQVRILPRAQQEGPAQERFSPTLALRRFRGRATRMPLHGGALVRMGDALRYEEAQPKRGGSRLAPTEPVHPHGRPVNLGARRPQASDMSVPVRLILGFEKHLPAARFRREACSSPPHLVLLVTPSLALPWHLPSIASFDHDSKAITHPQGPEAPQPSRITIPSRSATSRSRSLAIC